MFLRGAKNAGFEVPVEYVDEAVQYIQRCFDRRRNTYVYGLIGADRRVTRAMIGAGVLSLSLSGLHQSPTARAAGNWLLQHPFNRYNGLVGRLDRFHYGAITAARPCISRTEITGSNFIRDPQGSAFGN